MKEMKEFITVHATINRSVMNPAAISNPFSHEKQIYLLMDTSATAILTNFVLF